MKPLPNAGLENIEYEKPEVSSWTPPVFNEKAALQTQGRTENLSAANAANLAENLPDGAAVIIAAVSAREEEHLADLLFSICLAKAS